MTRTAKPRYHRERMEVTKEEFFAGVGGRADPEVKQRIAAALEDSQSNVSRWLAQMEAAAEQPFAVDWPALHELDERAHRARRDT
ncbi:MAG: hypothetical protein AB7U73_01450 [Pirellulales bacterium]